MCIERDRSARSENDELKCKEFCVCVCVRGGGGGKLETLNQMKQRIFIF